MKPKEFSLSASRIPIAARWPRHWPGASGREKSKPTVLDAESPLREYIEKLEVQSYEDIVTPYKSLQEYENLLLAFKEIVAEYNYEANQLNTAQKLGLSMLDKLSRLPAFPGVTEKQHYELEIIFEKLKEFSNKEMQDNTSITFLQKARKRIDRKSQGRKKRFEDDLSG